MVACLGGMQADGLIPVVEGHIVLLPLGLEGGTPGIGFGTVGEELHHQVQLIQRISLAPQLLLDMRRPMLAS